ncbi:sigma factor-like helix-turn-helix DNA-binding protein [Sphingomonas suaedae]|nr:sigma factor-like helix-turn-helix DNA-binding protein [Sphingomonas suaedae]
MNRRLRYRLQTMPEPERAVFDRARYRDLDYIQIAAELDISVAEVQRRLSSAMRHLVGWK